jgi:hypothetical protein
MIICCGITQFLNPFIVVGHHGCTQKLGYCEWCCNKHGCASSSVGSWYTFLWVFCF